MVGETVHGDGVGRVSHEVLYFECLSSSLAGRPFINKTQL